MAKCLINGTNNNGNTGRAIEVMNFFVGKGLSPTQACAIAGNCYVESGKAYDPKSLNKNDCNTSKTECGPSYGLFQWHDVCTRKNSDGSWDESSCSGRFKNLKSFCASRKLDYTTMKGQLEFLWHENAGGFKEYFQSNNKLTIEAYTKWWEKNWEACGTCDHNARVSEAKRLAGIYNQMNKTECTVETGGGYSSSQSGFTCNPPSENTSDINIEEEASSQTTSANSSGNNSSASNTTNNTVNTKTLFVGDSYAYRIYHNTLYLKNSATLLYGNGASMTQIASKLKEYLSNPKNRPKCVVVYCSDDTKFKTMANSVLYRSDARDKVKSYCRKILSACAGYKVYFVENQTDLALYGCSSNYNYSAASQLNWALAKIKSEGDSSNFTILKMPESSKNILRGYAVCTSDKRATFKPEGFRHIGDIISGAIYGI